MDNRIAVVVVVVVEVMVGVGFVVAVEVVVGVDVGVVVAVGVAVAIVVAVGVVVVGAAVRVSITGVTIMKCWHCSESFDALKVRTCAECGHYYCPLCAPCSVKSALDCRKHFIVGEQHLVMPVGLPRSGKSTLVDNLRVRLGAVIVSPDEVRRVLHGTPFRREAESVVWGMVNIFVPALFNAGHKLVVLDSCNITRSVRDNWKRPELWKRVYVDFTHVGVDTCIKRALELSRKDLVPVIKRMAASLDPIGEDEYD